MPIAWSCACSLLGSVIANALTVDATADRLTDTLILSSVVWHLIADDRGLVAMFAVAESIEASGVTGEKGDAAFGPVCDGQDVSRLLSTFVTSRAAAWIFAAIRAAMFAYVVGLLGRFLKRTLTGRPGGVAAAS